MIDFWRLAVRLFSSKTLCHCVALPALTSILQLVLAIFLLRVKSLIVAIPHYWHSRFLLLSAPLQCFARTEAAPPGQERRKLAFHRSVVSKMLFLVSLKAF